MTVVPIVGDGFTVTKISTVSGPHPFVAVTVYVVVTEGDTIISSMPSKAGRAPPGLALQVIVVAFVIVVAIDEDDPSHIPVLALSKTIVARGFTVNEIQNAQGFENFQLVSNAAIGVISNILIPPDFKLHF